MPTGGVPWWLGFSTFTSMVWVQSLVRELRSCKLCGVPKFKLKKKKEKPA